MQKENIVPSWHEKLRNILQIADLVKFAKAEPPDDLNERAMNDAVAFIEGEKQSRFIIPEDIDLETNKIWLLGIAALNNPFNYEFAHPWFFALLALMPLLGIWYYFNYRKRYPELRMPHMDVLKGVTSWRGRFRILLHLFRGIAFVLLVVALARPQRTLEEVQRSGEGIDIFLAIDLSSSMLAQDFKPNRLEVSKREATEFIDRREFDRIGLAVFAGEAFAQCPLTTDHRIVKKFIDELEAGTLQDGTAIGMGLAAAVNRLKDSDSESKIIVLLTDGMNNAGYIQPNMASNLAQEFGIRVYTIGVGTTGEAYAPTSRNRRGGYNFGMVPVEIDERLLNEIAVKTGGRYFRATNAQSLENIYKLIDKLEKTEIEVDSVLEISEEFHHFVRLALILLLLEVVLRYTLFREIP